MKREEIKAIFADATDEQLDKIMNINGADVEKYKSKVTALETEAKEKKEAFDKLTTEFNVLKQSGASDAEYKAKDEALVAENDAKAKQAEAEKLAKAKAESIANRFNAVVGDKEFSHDAIKAAYLTKFTEALEDKANEDKSDADVLHALTKDDAAAFKGVTTFKLAGGRTQTTGNGYSSVKEIMNSDMTREQKRQAIAENIAKGNIE